MPELPDVLVYVIALKKRIVPHVLESIEIKSPFLLRSVDPPISQAQGQQVADVRRLGKRIAISLANEVHLVFHLMISGRFSWTESTPRPGKATQAMIRFASGTLTLNETAKKKRASLYLVRGEQQLVQRNPGGIDVLNSNAAAFRDVLRLQNQTLKRALTDPHRFDGIGNAYSDEILHAAGLSPLQLTQNLSEAESTRLHRAAQSTLRHWIDQLADLFGDRFPKPSEITAFRDGFAVHGRFGQPCPCCAAPVQRIRYAERQTNYCPNCQTGGKLLADRSLSRLLRNDWGKLRRRTDDDP